MNYSRLKRKVWHCKQCDPHLKPGFLKKKLLRTIIGIIGKIRLYYVSSTTMYNFLIFIIASGYAEMALILGDVC